MSHDEYQRRRTRVREAIDRWADGSLPREIEPALFGELRVLAYARVDALNARFGKE